MVRAGAVVAALVVSGWASSARTQPCDGLVDAGPLIAGPGATDLGQIPEACPGRDLMLRLRGELLADTDDFYGVVTAGVTLRGRYRLTELWFLSAALDAATWRYPINAVVSSSGIGVGPATAGVHRAFLWHRTAVTPYARLLLPIDTARHHGIRYAGELGVSASRHVRNRWSVRAGLALPATLVTVGGVGHGAFLTSGLVEGAFAPRPWVSLALGTAARAQLAPRALLSALALRGAVRMATRRGLHFGLATEWPFAGDDRTDVTATIFVGWIPPETR